VTPWDYAVAASFVETIHATFMVAYFVGIPLLFFHRWPRVSRIYAVYEVAFVVFSQGSKLVWGHCFLTPLAGGLWHRSGAAIATNEWFTVRLSNLVFHSAPSHRIISWIGDAFVLVTAIGAVLRLRSHADRHPSSQRNVIGAAPAAVPLTASAHLDEEAWRES
jgi:hypothetical protein